MSRFARWLLPLVVAIVIGVAAATCASAGLTDEGTFSADLQAAMARQDELRRPPDADWQLRAVCRTQARYGSPHSEADGPSPVGNEGQ